MTAGPGARAGRARFLSRIRVRCGCISCWSPSFAARRFPETPRSGLEIPCSIFDILPCPLSDWTGVPRVAIYTYLMQPRGAGDGTSQVAATRRGAVVDCSERKQRLTVPVSSAFSA
jgi:hypothetical protein